METNEKPNYKCCNCMFYEGYFIKKGTRFERADSGFCCKKQNVVFKRDCCDRFLFKCRRFFSKSLVYRRLDSLLTDFSSLRDILEEEKRERKEYESEIENL